MQYEIKIIYFDGEETKVFGFDKRRASFLAKEEIRKHFNLIRWDDKFLMKIVRKDTEKDSEEWYVPENIF